MEVIVITCEQIILAADLPEHSARQEGQQPADLIHWGTDYRQAAGFN
jgi:hypothetical protein